MTSANPYGVLAERLGYSANHPQVVPILEYLMNPEAARMVEALPATNAEVAEKTGFPVERVVKEFDLLFRKGVIFPKGDFYQRDYYRFARNYNQIREATQSSPEMDHIKDRRYYELWNEFLNGEIYHLMGEQRRDQLAKGSSFFRVVPAFQSIKDLPGVLPHEDFREILKAQAHIAAVKCPCRYLHTAIGEHCDHNAEEEHWTCLMFARGAEYSVARGAGIALNAEKAIELAAQMEVDGLIHIFINASVVGGVPIACNCCTDCCIDILSVQSLDLPFGTVWAKSRYVAYMDSLDACSGCQDCVDRCQFDAIEMAKVSGAKKMKAVIEEDKCFGCGLCVVGCSTQALKMKAIRPPEHIPATFTFPH